MNLRNLGTWYLAAALATVGTTVGLHNAVAVPLGSAEVEQGVQVLTRGPVHEAFAETVTFDPEPGIVVPKAPPAAIEELPPDQKPEGANVAWIPGYWGWDDEQNNFLWVSGVWRALPPSRQWVPGYWGRASQGYQWTSGYWADAKMSEVTYLPEPPTTVEAGPNIAAPSPDNIWLPGCWLWQQGRYAWRPGFWASAQADWDWVPAHYVYAPRGYVFVDGYWDYSIGRRGVLFAPVYFDAGVYTRPGFSYSPTTVIDLGVFANHLFLRPRYQHYYFGDYYAANYQTAGFYASHSYNSGHYGYDPIYARQRWQHRHDSHWERRVASDFQHRRDHEDARPPHTWAAQRALGGNEASARERGLLLASPLSQFAKSPNSPMRFQPVDQSERRNLGQHGQEVQRFREQRQKLENTAAAPSTIPGSKESAPARAPLPRSPVASQPAEKLGRGYAPPKMHEAPKPDPMVEPRPRVARSSNQPQERTVNRLSPDTAQPQPQPRMERPIPQPKSQPKVERPIPQPQPQPRVERPAPQPQPRVERPAPQPQPRVERPAPQPQPQPRVERPAPQPRGNSPEAKQDTPKGNDKGRGK